MREDLESDSRERAVRKQLQEEQLAKVRGVQIGQFVTSFRGVLVSSTVESSVSSSMPSSSHRTSSQPEAGDPPPSQSVFWLKKAKTEDSEEGCGRR